MTDHPTTSTPTTPRAPRPARPPGPPPPPLPPGIARTISREELAALPIHRYEGPVHLVHTAEDLEKALHDLSSETVVGFDTETRPSFKKGQNHLPSLVQVATARAVYLFQLRRFDVALPLAEMLAAPRLVKVGIALADDLRQLKQLFPFEEKNVLDLGVVAQRCGLEKTGLRNLAGIFLRQRIPKGARTTNWEQTHLAPSQIIYAATDAWVCRELYHCFQQHGLLAHHAATESRAHTASAQRH